MPLVILNTYRALLRGTRSFVRTYAHAAVLVEQAASMPHMHHLHSDSDQRLTSQLVQALTTHGNMVRVVWDDSVVGQFHGIWLRDNCLCALCRDPGTQQRLLDSSSLPLNVAPTKVTCQADGIEVSWSGKDGHVSLFPADWLRHHAAPFLLDGHASFHSPKAKRSLLPSTEAWAGDGLATKITTVPYKQMMADGDNSAGLQKAFENLHRFGLSFIRGVPHEEGMVMKIAKHMSILKETSYGEMFDVVQDPGKVSHLANTGLALDMHTDLNYREKSPGLQFLLALELSCPEGLDTNALGVSKFVDGLAIGEWLRKERPADFHMLTSTPVTFAIKVKENTYVHQVPIFCLNSRGEIEEVHLNNRTMAPLQLSNNIVLPFYAAYKTLNDKIRSGEYTYEVQLLPGDLVVFNNRRVLHGRGPFDPHRVRRRLQGCYGDHDEFLSKYLALLRRAQADKTD